MVPVSRQEVPQHDVHALGEETSHTIVVPAIAVPTTLPTAPSANANSIEATATATDETTFALITRLGGGPA